MPLKYRPEINGLRAIAVFAVVFYHANLTVFGYELFHGGFLGVDVFFVISGYLITSIIVSDIRNNSFSFRYFYERRIRRIIPALFFMLLFSLILAWLFLLPDQLENYSYSLLGSIFFYSNFHFHYAGLQYAAESSLKLPLLHTWSLAIEEQYYIIFPVALYLVSKYLKRYILAIFVLGFVGSLLLAHWASITHPSINFYSLPTRGWELLAGALLAELEIRYSRRSSRLLTQIMPALGLLMILFSIGVFNHQILHPSIYSLIPITGCVLLIWFCQRDGFITKILSNKLLVGMGLISYSLYLWHHPIFAFARITGFADEQIYKSLLLILICVLFACFTYYFVEQPFRDRNIISKKTLCISIFISGFILICASNLIIKYDGFSYRVPNIIKNSYISTGKAQNIENQNLGEAKIIVDAKGEYRVFQNDDGCDNRQNTFCVFNENGLESVYLVGDSHMESLVAPLLDSTSKNNIKLTLMLNDGCPYIPETNRHHRKTGAIDKKCDENIQQARRLELINDPSSIVIIGGYYPLYLSEYYFDNMEGGVEVQIDGGRWASYFEPVGIKTSSQKEREQFMNNYFKNSILELAENGNKIILVYPVPGVGWNPVEKIFMQSRRFYSEVSTNLAANPISTSYQVYLKRTETSFNMLDGIKHSNVYRVYPHDLFCDTAIKNRCISHDLENMFYKNDDHLSFKGAQLLSILIENEIRKIQK